MTQGLYHSISIEPHRPRLLVKAWSDHNKVDVGLEEVGGEPAV